MVHLNLLTISNVRFIEFQKEQYGIAGDVNYQRPIKGQTSAGQIFDHKSINVLASLFLIVILRHDVERLVSELQHSFALIQLLT